MRTRFGAAGRAEREGRLQRQRVTDGDATPSVHILSNKIEGGGHAVFPNHASNFSQARAG